MQIKGDVMSAGYVARGGPAQGTLTIDLRVPADALKFVVGEGVTIEILRSDDGTEQGDEA